MNAAVMKRSPIKTPSPFALKGEGWGEGLRVLMFRLLEQARGEAQRMNVHLYARSTKMLGHPHPGPLPLKAGGRGNLMHNPLTVAARSALIRSRPSASFP
jgi:hypothetical protein